MTDKDIERLVAEIRRQADLRELKRLAAKYGALLHWPPTLTEGA